MASFFGLPDEKMNIVWVLTFLRDGSERHTTGFAVTDSGHIMTTAHMLDPRFLESGIMARRLDQSTVSVAEVVNICPKWNVAMLKISKKTPYGEFSSNGNLLVEQPLLYIGNPGSEIGCSLFGRVCFPCVDNPTIPIDNNTCKIYQSTERQTTPRYRVLGHFYNSPYFLRDECEKYLNHSKKFVETLHPLVPIVQVSGFCNEGWFPKYFGGRGLEGGPMFDTYGQIVGMMITDEDEEGSQLEEGGYQLAIHVSLLKHFMQLCLNIV